MAYAGVSNIVSHSRFSSSVFSISVGPHNEPFFAHESVLSQSPVLGRMCIGDFKESKQKHIDLPEDNATTFGKVLDYLYSGDLGPPTQQTMDGYA